MPGDQCGLRLQATPASSGDSQLESSRDRSKIFRSGGCEFTSGQHCCAPTRSRGRVFPTSPVNTQSMTAYSVTKRGVARLATASRARQPSARERSDGCQSESETWLAPQQLSLAEEKSKHQNEEKKKPVVNIHMHTFVCTCAEAFT